MECLSDFIIVQLFVALNGAIKNTAVFEVQCWKTFLSQATWLEGHSLAQTVFINLYLHDPSQVNDRTLRTFCVCFLKLVDCIRDRINRAGVFEEVGFLLKCCRCCIVMQTGWQRFDTVLHWFSTGYMFLYTIQPVLVAVDPFDSRFDNRLYCVYSRLSNRFYNLVWQPVERTVAVRSTRLSKRFNNRFDNRLYHVNKLPTGWMRPSHMY